VEVERLRKEYDVEVRHAPYLLDPSTPPEGKARRPMTRPEDPPTEMELRAESLGIKFTRGRTWTSNTLLAHQGGEFAFEHGRDWEYTKAMFKAYFEGLQDIGTVDAVVAVGESAGLDAVALREALEQGTYRDRVIEGIRWTREIGVSGVPTYVFAEKYAIVGAQDYNVFESIIQRLGKTPKA
jgi:predicted DsbA family dithiol-disulfide isomerase